MRHSLKTWEIQNKLFHVNSLISDSYSKIGILGSGLRFITIVMVTSIVMFSVGDGHQMESSDLEDMF